ncbi:hypothetical protein MMC17_003652 [Xylographa soralifera]|nr:hypothetical protein [Xylographa soralifera]
MPHRNVLIILICFIVVAVVQGVPLSHEYVLVSRSSDLEFIEPQLLSFDDNELGPAGIIRALQPEFTSGRGNDVIQAAVQRHKCEEAVGQSSTTLPRVSHGSASKMKLFLPGIHISASQNRIGVVVKPEYAKPSIAAKSQRRHHVVKRSLKELAKRHNNIRTRSPRGHPPAVVPRAASAKAIPQAQSVLLAKEKRDGCAEKHGIHHLNCEISQGFKKVGQDIKNVAQKAVKGVENVATKIDQGVVKAAKVVDNKVVKPVGKFIQKNGKILKEVAIEAGTAIAGAAIEAVTLGTGTGAVVGLEAGAQALVQVATKVPTVVKAVEGAEKVGKGIKDVVDAGKDAKAAATAAKDAAKAADTGKVKQTAAGAKAAAKSFGKNKNVQNAAKSGAKKVANEGEKKVKEKYQQNQQNQQGNNNGNNQRN